MHNNFKQTKSKRTGQSPLNTKEEPEDNSDFKVVAASLIQKKKSGPTSVKQHYAQERLP